MSKTRPEREKTGRSLLPIVYLIAALIGLYSRNISLPEWLSSVLSTVLPIFIVLLVAIGLILGLREGWSLGIKDLLIAAKTWWVVRARFREFDGYVQRLLEQTDATRIDNLLYVVSNLQFGSRTLKIPWSWYVHTLAYHLKEMSWAKRNLEALVWNVNVFNTVLREFSELYINAAIDQILEIGFSYVEGNYRHKLVNGRERHVRFLDDWDGFVDSTNRALPLPSLTKQAVERPKALT